MTYSEGDLNKVNTRERFAEIFANTFGVENVKYWACCFEKHDDDEGLHFHIALKLNKVKRWKSVKEKVANESGIVCHFREFHTNYYDAFEYVTKSDPEYVTSVDHPNLINKPRTAVASRKRLSSANDVTEHPLPPVKSAKKREKLDNLKVYDIIIDQNLRSEQDLFVLANSQKEEGKVDLLEYILKMSKKRRAELLETAWLVNDSTSLP